MIQLMTFLCFALYIEYHYKHEEKRYCTDSNGNTNNLKEFKSKGEAETECDTDPDCFYISSANCKFSGRFRICPNHALLKNSLSPSSPWCVYHSTLSLTIFGNIQVLLCKCLLLKLCIGLETFQEYLCCKQRDGKFRNVADLIS